MNPIIGRTSVSVNALEGRVRSLDLLIALFVLSLLLAAAVYQFHTYNKYARSSPLSQESAQEAAEPSVPTKQK